MDVTAALASARQAGLARLDAQLLVAHHLQRPRAWVLAHGDAPVDAAAASAIGAGIARRAAGVPLAYLVGVREFHGLALAVTPAVLVPRPDTEGLVDWALELLGGRAVAVVDLGTGSGAVALAISQACPAAHVTGTDSSVAALAVAAANGRRLGLPVALEEGDWWLPLAGRRFGLAVSNPPYIAAEDPHLQALAHEPRAALTPEGDGLSALQALVDGAPPHLEPGAWLLLEHGHTQADSVRRMFRQRGFDTPHTRVDLAGLDRCTGARWPG